MGRDPNTGLDVYGPGSCNAGVDHEGLPTFPQGSDSQGTYLGGECNEPSNNHGATQNCRRGYDCKYCGIWSANEGNYLSGTHCDDQHDGRGCNSRIPTTPSGFDCCYWMCYQFGQVGTGCPACSG